MRRPVILGTRLAILAALFLAARGRLDPPPGLPEPPESHVDAPRPLRPDDRVAHNGIFAALGRATYRHRRWLPVAGLVVVIGLNVWGAAAGGRLSQGGWQVPGSEGVRAEELFADRFGET